MAQKCRFAQEVDGFGDPCGRPASGHRSFWSDAELARLEELTRINALGLTRSERSSGRINLDGDGWQVAERKKRHFINLQLMPFLDTEIHQFTKTDSGHCKHPRESSTQTKEDISLCAFSFSAGYGYTQPRGEKTVFQPFIHKCDIFTKTGSGLT